MIVKKNISVDRRFAIGNCDVGNNENRMQIAKDIIAACPDHFEPDFIEWLNNNWHVYMAFEAFSNEVWFSGVTHYSAKCIWGVMRFESTVRDRNSEFKLNNNRSYACARLYIAINPSRAGFFEFRNRFAITRNIPLDFNDEITQSAHVTLARNSLNKGLMA